MLDAVCFALYGAVPGERNDAKRLRSDQADAETPPRVVLDATLAGRRFRIERSPAWARPKRRGSGTTPQQASVVISERLDGGWVPLSTRLDETGHLVTALVGMNLTQFTQVAMLPQGRFQAFLRASSEDRHRLLQQLFRTERFEQVERGCATDGSRCTAAARSTSGPSSALVHRVSETAEASLPTGRGVAAPLERRPDVVGPRPRRRAGRRAAGTAGGRADGPRRRSTLLARPRSSGAGTPRQPANATRCSARDAEIECPTGPRRAGRSGPGRPAPAPDRGRRPAPSTTPRSRVRPATGRRPPTLLGLAPDDARRRRRAGLARGGRRRGGRGPGPAAARARARHARPRGSRPPGPSATPSRPGETGSRRWSPASSGRGQRQARLATEQAACDDAARRLDACRHLQAVRNDLVSAQLDLNAVVSSRLRLVEELVTLQQTRLDGMAAEIAGRLAVGGGSCPVCGSEHHPHLATAAVDAPDAAAEKALRKRLDDAEFEEHARAAKARDLETQAALALQVAGSDDLEALHLAVAETTATLGATAAEAAALADLERAAAEAEEQTVRLAELDATVAELADRVAERDRRASRRRSVRGTPT